mmetsp:Transcript_17324/g.39841  ORF Transcript_17324/g.39841 Transcript_17324/m.39841 type:complete len:598 (+) Transcript_17324:219-2012(+)|eukprot:CAMPEP_0172411576 /NCGR_PEP_ID=MMETSP1061-20121228/77466_1 /TAXON_ID=37318 /ORGANISM="Pseudo-nitzschia pungens, Strain cf. pungens" /LENGTH=597 /DNA_ID=CAMNT_0013147789 /DNA_START=178 /DNA_END=1971 /DNA_ORIENTATION=+
MTQDMVFDADGGDGLEDDISLLSGFDDEIIYKDDSFCSANSCSDNNNDTCSKSDMEFLAIRNSGPSHKWQETTGTRKRGPSSIGMGNGGNTLNVIEPPLGQTTEVRKDRQQQQQSPCPTDCKVDPSSTRKIEPMDTLFVKNGSSTAQNKSKNSSSSLKSDMLTAKASRARLKNIMIKQNKNEGLLTRALKAKYRNSASRQQLALYSASARQLSSEMTLSSSRSDFSRAYGSEMDEVGTPSVGKVNATWNTASGVETSGNTSFLSGSVTRNRLLSATYKTSSLQDLLAQSTVTCRSQSLLRECSAQSLSKRNSFQSIKSLNKKLDVSSLLPAKGYTKRRSASRRWSCPAIATTAPTTPTLSEPNKAGMRHTNHAKCDSSDSLLHQSCRLFPNSHTVIETALRFDVDAVRRSVVVTDEMELNSLKWANSALYGYPINIALNHGANAKVLQLLVESGPDVLAYKDGANCCASLGTALSLKQCELDVVDLLITANQQCARVADRRGNYPLHVAVSYGRSLEIVKRLCSVYPEARDWRNFHSQTPLDIAVQSTRCSEEVTDFLRCMECPAPFAVVPTVNANEKDHAFGSLEDGLDDIMQTNF